MIHQYFGVTVRLKFVRQQLLKMKCKIQERKGKKKEKKYKQAMRMLRAPTIL